jgi:hypothetical protein
MDDQRTDREGGSGVIVTDRKSRFIRVAVVIWATISLLVAFLSFYQMTLTQPKPYRGEVGKVALDYMNSVVSGLTLFAWSASAMLAVNAFLMVWLVWRRTKK